MKLLRMIWLTGFLGLMSLAAQQVSQANAMQPPKFSLTDLGSVDGQANPYTPPTGYSIRDVYDPNKQGHRIGWTFTKDGSNTNLLPSDMANQNWYQINGYSSSGVMFGDDTKTGTSFYYNTKTNEYGNFKNSGLFTHGITSMNSSGQALGLTWTTIDDEFGNKIAWNIPTYYNSLMSDPVLLKDLIATSLDRWLLIEGGGINDNGQIFGKMINMTNNQTDYYRLDPVPIPVPEPSSFAVITSGVLLYIGRKKLREKR